MIQITDEHAKALVEEGPCAQAKRILCEDTKLTPSVGVCQFCDLAGLLVNSSIKDVGLR